MNKSIGLAFILASTTLAADLSGGRWAIGNPDYDSTITLLFTDTHVLSLSERQRINIYQKFSSKDGFDLYTTENTDFDEQGNPKFVFLAKFSDKNTWINSRFSEYLSQVSDWIADTNNYHTVQLKWIKPTKDIPPKNGTLTDPRDNTTYATVTLGGKTWMAQDLRYRTPNSKCASVDEQNATICQHSVHYPFADRNIACPPKWHVPSNAEWLALAVEVVKTEPFTGKLNQKFWYDTKGFSALGESANYGPYWSSNYKLDDNNGTDRSGFFLSHSGLEMGYWGASDYSAAMRCVAD